MSPHTRGPGAPGTQYPVSTSIKKKSFMHYNFIGKTSQKQKKINDIYQKWGWGQNFMKTNFFFAIVTLGWGEILYDAISLHSFSIFNLLLAHLHGNFQYFPYIGQN